jgi:hypothetical protein
MTDDQLRELVRDAIARHLGPQAHAAANAQPTAAPLPLWRSHPSFAKLLVADGVKEGGPCLIEPSVSCNLCGYCQSFGH